MRRDLELPWTLLASDRPEALALCPDGVGPVGHDALRLVGTRVGGEIDVARTREELAADEQIAHDATDEIEPATLGREQFGERSCRIEHRP